MGARGGLSGVVLDGCASDERARSADDDCGFEGQAEEGVGPSAMMLEGGDGAVDGPEGVEVGGFGGERHGDGGVGCLAIEAGAGEAGSGHEVGYGFHGLGDAFYEVSLAGS